MLDQKLDCKLRWGTPTGDGNEAGANFVAFSVDSSAVLPGPWKLVVSGNERELKSQPTSLCYR